MNKILIVLVIVALGGGVYWYAMQVPAQEAIVTNTQGLREQKDIAPAKAASKTTEESTNSQAQPIAPATHKRQLFWMIPVGKTVYATDNRFSLRLSKKVELVDGQMASEVTVVTPEKTQMIPIGLSHTMNISVPVSGSKFNIEVCSLGQEVSNPDGEASFAISFGADQPLCPNTFQGESPTDPKFNP